MGFDTKKLNTITMHKLTDRYKVNRNDKLRLLHNFNLNKIEFIKDEKDMVISYTDFKLDTNIKMNFIYDAAGAIIGDYAILENDGFMFLWQKYRYQNLRDKYRKFNMSI